MAKVTVEFDSESGSLSCSVDGKQLADLMEVSFHKDYEGDYCFGATLSSADDSSGLTTWTRLMAGYSREALNTPGAIPSIFPGLVVAKKTSLEKDISKFFEGRR